MQKLCKDTYRATEEFSGKAAQVCCVVHELSLLFGLYAHFQMSVRIACIGPTLWLAAAQGGYVQCAHAGLGPQSRVLQASMKQQVISCCCQSRHRCGHIVISSAGSSTCTKRLHAANDQCCCCCYCCVLCAQITGAHQRRQAGQSHCTRMQKQPR